MNNLLVVPLLVPLMTAAILVFFKEKMKIQRMISGVSVLFNVGVAGWIVVQVKQDGIQTLNMGGWMPPYGIVFVADMFAALLVLAASMISCACLFYSFGSIGEKRERMFFYPLFHFMLAGVYGSFLTGDLFNLFVCFEVMLISSYALIVLGNSRQQLRETLKYILINILSSALFVVAVAYLYATVGTLNMAHLSIRVAEMGQGGMLNVIAVLLLIVFSLKAGLFLFYWLPGSYGASPAAVQALFGGLLTKVGLYAIIRMFTLVFTHDEAMTHSWIGWMAAATMILGCMGALAYHDLRRILNYNLIIGVGFVAFGISIVAEEALNGVVFYLLHDIIAKTLLFILGGLIIAIAGTDQLADMGGFIKRYPRIGWMFFGTVLAVVGIPPFSGFPGKLMLIRSGFNEQAYWITALGLVSSFIVLYSLMKVFQRVFWGEVNMDAVATPRKLKMMTAAATGLFIVMIVMGLGAEWVYSFVSQAGEELSQPARYIESVMKG